MFKLSSHHFSDIAKDKIEDGIIDTSAENKYKLKKVIFLRAKYIVKNKP